VIFGALMLVEGPIPASNTQLGSLPDDTGGVDYGFSSFDLSSCRIAGSLLPASRA
jgi:hypothetical protein